MVGVGLGSWNWWWLGFGGVAGRLGGGVEVVLPAAAAVLWDLGMCCGKLLGMTPGYGNGSRLLPSTPRYGLRTAQN